MAGARTDTGLQWWRLAHLCAAPMRAGRGVRMCQISVLARMRKPQPSAYSSGPMCTAASRCRGDPCATLAKLYPVNTSSHGSIPPCLVRLVAAAERSVASALARCHALRLSCETSCALTK